MASRLLISTFVVLALLELCDCGGHGGGHKKVIIHVPFKIKHIHHTRTVVKHVDDHGGDEEGYKVIGYSGGIDDGEVVVEHGHGGGDHGGHHGGSFGGDHGGIEIGHAVSGHIEGGIGGGHGPALSDYGAGHSDGGHDWAGNSGIGGGHGAALEGGYGGGDSGLGSYGSDIGGGYGGGYEGNGLSGDGGHDFSGGYGGAGGLESHGGDGGHGGYD